MNFFKILAHGEGFDVDSFLISSTLTPHQVWHKGEGGDGFRNRPTSGFEIILGEGRKLDTYAQEEIATAYLEENEQALRQLGEYRGVDYFSLFIQQQVEMSSSLCGFWTEHSARLMYFALRVKLRLQTYVDLIRPDSPIEEPSDQESCSESERVHHRTEFEQRHQLDEVHKTILSYLLMEPPRPATEAASRSRAWAKDTCRPVVQLEDYERGIRELVERGFVWVVDDRAIQRIREYLDAEPALGPIDGLPEIDTMQISVAYARLLNEYWLKIGRRHGVVSSREWVSEELTRVYCHSAASCLKVLRMELEDIDTRSAIVHVSGPTQCSSWRCHWWEKYESGHCLEIRYRSKTET